MDGHTCRDGAAGAVDIQADILIRVLPFQIQQLCHYQTGRSIIDILAQNDDTVVQQTGEDIVGTLPGGSISAGMAIHDTMRYIKCDVSTICMGMAASMGAFLLASGTKGKRFALPNAEIMIHQPLIAGGQGGGLSGQATDIKIHADHIVRTREKMNRMLSEYTGQPLEKVQLDTERDNFLSAEEAKAYGLIDEVIAHR